MQEERQHEENLRQQIESSEQRIEEEQRKMREKLEREQRKQEMMRIAIEKARQEAEMERKKKRSACVSTGYESDYQDERTPVDQENKNVETESSPRSPILSKSDANEDADDGEKILIGTPIKMRKKTLNKTYKIPVSAKREVSVQSEKEQVTTATDTNVDGIALVLQSLPPIMPILSNDIINLNQNINNLNTSNIQLAVMLAHQMQQLTSIAQNQTQLPEKNQTQLPEFTNNKINAVETNCMEEKVSSTQNDVEDSTSNEVCKQCTGQISTSHDDDKVNNI